MGDETYVFDNKHEREINELYLNTKGADVNFVFKDSDTRHIEKIPAHKIILSLDSPVFDRMFFGSLQEKGDVEIVDASAAAFKEFLQFFYLDEVTLSVANIIYVTNLCKKYEMDEFLAPCEIAIQNSLTMDDMCWGYNIAQLMDQENLKRFCETKIKTCAAEIIKSESFLECDRKSLSKIMTLVSSDWHAVQRVIAYMEWSKTQCNRNNLDSSPKNLRNQLKNVFKKIPFGKLSIQQLSQHVATYKGFFTAKELEELFVQKSSSKQPEPFDLHLLQSDVRGLDATVLEATFNYAVHDFSKMKDPIRSPPFYVRNLPWKIMVMQRTSSSGNGGQDTRKMGFYLQCNAESESSSWSCNAKAELKLLSHKPDQGPFVRHIKHLFYSEENDWGFQSFIEWNVVLDPERGYIKDDTIVVEVHLVAETPEGVF